MGNCGVPFMNRTTSLDFTSASMIWLASAMGCSCPRRSRRQAYRLSIVGCLGRQRKGVQHATHATLQRCIDHLMLLDPGLALEGGRDHGGRIVVPVPGEILDLDLGVRDRS